MHRNGLWSKQNKLLCKSDTPAAIACDRLSFPTKGKTWKEKKTSQKEYNGQICSCSNDLHMSGENISYTSSSRLYPTGAELT